MDPPIRSLAMAFARCSPALAILFFIALTLSDLLG
jgi:hypothetical protein